MSSHGTTRFGLSDAIDLVPVGRDGRSAAHTVAAFRGGLPRNVEIVHAG